MKSGISPVGPGMPEKKGKKALVAVIVVVILIAAGGLTAYELLKPPTTTSSKITITVWGSGSPGGEAEVFNSSMVAFEKAYPNITIDDSPAVGIASTTYLSAAHAGKAPDVYRDTSDNAGTLYAAGAIQNLRPMLNSSYIDSFTNGTIKDWTLNGGFYGIPVNTNGVGLYYNKAYVTTPPTTIYQLIQEAETITKDNPGVYGLAYGLGTDDGYRSAAWFPAFGGTIFNLTTQMPELNSAADISAVSLLYNLTYVYKVSPQGLTTMSSQCDLFEEGKTAFIVEGPWDQAEFTKALGSNLGVTALPYNNVTHDWPEPIWGSVGYVISTHVASGITSAQTWASLQFIKFETNYTAQKELFAKAGDFPSLKSVARDITSETSIDPLIAGWLDQENHTQIQPSFVNMNYYWPNFGTLVGNLYDNGTNNVTAVMDSLQSAVLSEIHEEASVVSGYPYLIASQIPTQLNPLINISYFNNNLIAYATNSNIFIF